MGKPLSMDLRSRALAAVDEGMSCRAAARRYGVAAATVIRWHDQRRNTVAMPPRPKAATPDRSGSRRIGTRYWRCTKHVATSRWTSCAASLAKLV